MCVYVCLWCVCVCVCVCWAFKKQFMCIYIYLLIACMCACHVQTICKSHLELGKSFMHLLFPCALPASNRKYIYPIFPRYLKSTMLWPIWLTSCFKSMECINCHRILVVVSASLLQELWLVCGRMLGRIDMKSEKEYGSVGISISTMKTTSEGEKRNGMKMLSR